MGLEHIGILKGQEFHRRNQEIKWARYVLGIRKKLGNSILDNWRREAVLSFVDSSISLFLVI